MHAIILKLSDCYLSSHEVTLNKSHF